MLPTQSLIICPSGEREIQTASRHLCHHPEHLQARRGGRFHSQGLHREAQRRRRRQLREGGGGRCDGLCQNGVWERVLLLLFKLRKKLTKSHYKCPLPMRKLPVSRRISCHLSNRFKTLKADGSLTFNLKAPHDVHGIFPALETQIRTSDNESANKIWTFSLRLVHFDAVNSHKASKKYEWVMNDEDMRWRMWR